MVTLPLSERANRSAQCFAYLRRTKEQERERFEDFRLERDRLYDRDTLLYKMGFTTPGQRRYFRIFLWSEWTFETNPRRA